MLRTLRALCPALLLCASMALAAPAVTGTWNAQVEGRNVELQLRGDGTGSYDGAALTWQMMAGMLLVESGGEVASYAVSVQGERMTVSGGDFSGPVNFQRGKAATAKPAAKQAQASSSGGARADLTGKWCYAGSFTNINNGGGSQSSRCFELRGDGSYVYHYEGSVSAYGGGMYGGSSSQSGDSGRWSATATTLTAQSASSGAKTYQLQLRNHPKNRDPMICLDGDCYTTYWQKAPW